ncbi:hypothetical protein [Chondromyces crocatus]|uniref:Uncharacterized protein n=1 Tax=Chondromyces crocatus TaxID=52 RepID=A0A0K1E929_CHOCO|nr:hypothetical protein [Chondromyces crocatus]AKT37063.1 uncharacterized protein CMC5_011890 [Chondromyces crocatus]
MPVTVDNSGDIETFCQNSPVSVGDPIRLVFRAYEEATAPFNVRIRSPGGKVIFERVLRELPTGQPQSAPAVEFSASAAGEYRLEIKQLYGKQRGEAVLHVRLS